MAKHEGDSAISPFELNLWMLHQEVLHRWGVYTVFRLTRFHVPQMKNQVIEWFVPGDTTHSYEITEFIKQELAGEVRAAEADWPGAEVTVSIFNFSGVAPYLTREQGQIIAKEAMQRFAQMYKGMKKKE